MVALGKLGKKARLLLLSKLKTVTDKPDLSNSFNLAIKVHEK